MSALAWNCRGLGNPNTVQVLLDLVQLRKPMLVFLMETMIDHDRIEAIMVKMKYEGLFTVAGPGHGGGLALFWKRNNEVQIKTFSHNHIDIEITMEGVDRWRMTCFYGYPERNRRRDSWEFLRHLSNLSTLPWVVIGDFNDILRATKKKGQHVHPNWLINGFRDALGDSGLIDLPMEGYPFTWERSKGTERWVEERLDRAYATQEWRNMFVAASLTNLIAHTSDHSAIHLQISV
ncbi:uncharacterized protein LOC141691577 [Apium graveolens]|uniref:uncharacterized protein LOC141691577 n=1 Tax=Apium graveolens TaxID=4045 RepID=UPI003D7A43D6